MLLDGNGYGWRQWQAHEVGLLHLAGRPQRCRILQGQCRHPPQPAIRAGDEFRVNRRCDDKSTRHRKPALRENGEVSPFATAQFELRGQRIFKGQGKGHDLNDGLVVGS